MPIISFKYIYLIEVAEQSRLCLEDVMGKSSKKDKIDIEQGKNDEIVNLGEVVLDGNNKHRRIQ